MIPLAKSYHYLASRGKTPNGNVGIRSAVNADPSIPANRIAFLTLDTICCLDGKPLAIGMLEVQTCRLDADMNKTSATLVELAHSGKYHIVIAPEYSFLPSSGPISKETKEIYLRAFSKASENGVMIIPGTFVWHDDEAMYNTAFVFYNGKIIFRYDKINNLGDSPIAEVRGLKARCGTEPGVFEWNGMRIGLEICADAGSLYQNGIRDRDISFLLSSGMDTLQYTMLSVRRHGYGILADGCFCGLAGQQKSNKRILV